MDYDFGYEKVTESMYKNVEQQVKTCNSDEACKSAEAMKKALQAYDSYPEKLLRIWEESFIKLEI